MEFGSTLVWGKFGTPIHLIIDWHLFFPSPIPAPHCVCFTTDFYAAIKKSGASPLVWTTNLMCPEAYTLDAILDFWIKHRSPQHIKEEAASVYNQYLKCGIKGARRLFATGF